MLGKYNRRTVSETSGAVVGGAIVRVFVQATGAPVTLYSDPDGVTAIGTEYESGDQGEVEFFIYPGIYRITVEVDGVVVEEITHEHIVGDLAVVDASDTALSLMSMPTPEENSYIRIAPSGAAEFRTAADLRTDLSISNVDNTSDANKPVSTATQTALDLKIDETEKGAANGVASLDSGGKIPNIQLPSIAITDTFVATSEAAMLALVADTGDVAVRTDLNKSFILAGNDPTTLTDWQELLSPSDGGPLDYADYDSLRADLHLLTAGDSVTITSPGIGGTFVVYDETQTDNGGTVLVADSNPAKCAKRLFTGAVNIQWFGAVDDDPGDGTGTNSKPAFDTVFALPKPITVLMPKTDTGVYLYDGEHAFTDLSDLYVEADQGVSVYKVGDGGYPPIYVPGIQTNREVQGYYEPRDSRTFSGPFAAKRPSEMGRLMSSRSGYCGIPESITANSEFYHFSLVSWPNGSWASATPTSTSATQINWGSTLTTGFEISVTPVVVGDQIQAIIGGAPLRCGIAVETVGGWCIVFGRSDETGYQVVYKEGVANSTLYTIAHEPLLAEAPYKTINALSGVIILDAHSFGLMSNGIIVKRIRLPSAILAAGWCAGFQTGGTFTIDYPSRFRRKVNVGSKQLRIVCAGDSISALPHGQFNYMSQFLSGMGGLQVEELNNLSVSGHTSTAQRALLLAEDISGYDFCLIQIGVNDIQVGISVATFLSNIEDMLDYCDTNMVVPIVGLPTMFYSQTDAQLYGQDGQPTTNSAAGATYRAQLLRHLADRGTHVCSSSLEDWGAVLASLLATDNDPILQDNIHPTAFGQMCLGFAWAKTLAALLMQSDYRRVAVSSRGTWWTGNLGNTSTPSYTISDGMLTWSGRLSRDSVTVNDGDTIGTLPLRLRPAVDTFFHAVNVSSTVHTPMATPTAIIHIGADGVVRAFKVDASCIYLGFNVSYPV